MTQKCNGCESQDSTVDGVHYRQDDGVKTGACTSGDAVRGEAVAWAVTAARGGIHKLSITKESAERKAARWQEEWPDNGCRVRPLVFGDVALISARAADALDSQPTELPFDRKEFIRQVVLAVCEIPDRDSPKDQPEMMLVTDYELASILESCFEYADETSSQPTDGEVRK